VRWCAGWLTVQESECLTAAYILKPFGIHMGIRHLTLRWAGTLVLTAQLLLVETLIATGRSGRRPGAYPDRRGTLRQPRPAPACWSTTNSHNGEHHRPPCA
jgi:hypothetical protein